VQVEPLFKKTQQSKFWIVLEDMNIENLLTFSLHNYKRKDKTCF